MASSASPALSHVGPIPWPAGAPRPALSTLPGLIDALAASQGDRPAVVFEGHRTSYAELAERSRRVAAALQGLGAGRDGAVGLLAPNSADWLVLTVGAVRAGAQVHVFNTWVKPGELDYLLRASRVEVLVSTAGFASNDILGALTGLIPEARLDAPGGWSSDRFPHLRTVAILGEECPVGGFHRWGPLAEQAGPLRVDHSRPADALVVYTSGSTRFPKAVPLTQSAMIENGYAIGTRMHLSRDDRVWLGSPLFWSYGIANAAMATFTHGACLVLENRFDARRAAETMRRERCTAAYLLPAMVESLRSDARDIVAKLDHLRTGLTIGRPDELKCIADELGITSICNIYGSTEVYGNCCVTDADDPIEVRMVSQGLPLPGVEIRVVDQESGDVVPRSLPGHLQVRGRVMPGYLPVVDGEQVPDPITGDGWYDTGDTALIREDGRLVFVGRHSEMIKVSGINVSPAEIEAHLRTHPAVARAAVVAAPDPQRDEVPIAFVVTSGPTSEAELTEHCRRALSSYKMPARVVLVSALPLTSTGKLARKALLDEARKVVRTVA